jgi:hypothetical protein
MSKTSRLGWIPPSNQGRVVAPSIAERRLTPSQRCENTESLANGPASLNSKFESLLGVVNELAAAVKTAIRPVLQPLPSNVHQPLPSNEQQPLPLNAQKPLPSDVEKPLHLKRKPRSMPTNGQEHEYRQPPGMHYPNHSQAVMAMWEDEDDADYEEEALAMRRRHNKNKQRKRMEYMMSLGSCNMPY